jgi:putative ABC transport system permease protein
MSSSRSVISACYDILQQDIGYALRGLRRAPGLTATILLTFALGIGVNAAMFTVVDRVFFQAPPGIVDPSAVRRLISFSRGYERVEFPSDYFTTTDITHFREAVGSGAEIEGFDSSDHVIDHDTQKHAVAYATTGFFHLAGTQPYRGRFFSADENHYGDARNVAILNYDYWRRAFSADSAILGRTIHIDTTVFTIIGIAQPRFEGMDLDVVDVWVPLASMPAGFEGPWWNGDFNVVRLFARLDPSANERAIQTRLNTQYRRDRASMVERDSTARLEVAPLLQARSALGLGRQDDRNLALMIRLAGVGLVVLIIAVSNVASLLLMRALRRRREIAIRVALGVSRRRLGSQLLVESVLLAVVGGAAAVLIAFWTGGVLRTLLVSDVHWSATLIDRRVIAFTMVVAVLAGVAAGLAPATIALRRDIIAALKAGSSESGRPRSFLRITLLVTQTALCMLMLAAAGVFLQSLRRASLLDLGFDADRLITFQLFRINQDVSEEAVARIRALPSVATTSLSEIDLRGGGVYPIHFSNGDSVPVLLSPMAGYVDTAFAGTVGLRLVGGRLLSTSDTKGSEPIVVINQAMADEYWPHRNPLGECIHVGLLASPCRRIVGVVGTTQWYLAGTPQKMFYMPATQSPYAHCCSSVSVRTRGRATATTIAEIRRIVSVLPGQEPEYPPTPRLVVDRLEPQYRPWRIAVVMFLLFGILALAAAGAGIYGLVGFDVTQRTHEFGVRITLGATSRNILGLVLGSGLRVVVIGLIAGVSSALIAGRVLSSLLFNTSPYDPVVLAATAVTLSVVALLASLVPAWRATRVQPVIALRAD